MPNELFYSCDKFKGKITRSDGLITIDQCRGCFNTHHDKTNGGRYDSRPQCVRASGARKVRVGAANG